MLKLAKHGRVLDFRLMLAGSSSIQAVMSEIAGPLDQLYSLYSKGPKRIGKGPNCAGAEATAAIRSGAAEGTLSLTRFHEMCQDAGLIGSSLSRHQAKMAFVHSLVITPDSQGPRRPLLSRGDEFHEAIARLVLAWNPQGAGSWQYQMDPLRLGPAAAEASGGKPRTSVRQAKPGTLGSAAGMAASASQTVSEAVDRLVEDETTTFEEGTLLSKLPAVCGKLIALTMNTPRYHPTKGTPTSTPRQ